MYFYVYFYGLLFSAVDNKALPLPWCPWCHGAVLWVLWVPSESNGSMGTGSIEVFLEIRDNVFLRMSERSELEANEGSQ